MPELERGSVLPTVLGADSRATTQRNGSAWTSRFLVWGAGPGGWRSSFPEVVRTWGRSWKLTF